MNKLFLFFVFCLFPCFAQGKNNFHLPRKPLDRERAKIQKAAIEMARSKHCVDLVSGVGGIPNMVLRSNGMLLSVKDPLNEEQARELIVDLTEFLLKKINSNKILKKYMDKEALQETDIFISLLLQDKQGHARIYPSLSSVTKGFNRSRIWFEKDTWKDGELVTVEEKIESYQDAKEKVLKKRSQTTQTLH